jgi:hypothetical protein
MHLDDEMTQRWIHGELDPAARSAASAHLADCVACRQRLENAEREDRGIRRRFELMDHPVPAMSSATIRRGPRWPSQIRWAAGILLTFAVAGAAYAAPGSPLPRWLHQAKVWLSGPTPSAPATPTPRQVTAGISVPIEPRLLIRFAAPQAAGTLRLAIVDSGSVTIRVTNGVASLSSSTGLLGIDNRQSAADYELDIPRASPWIDIVVGQRTLLQKRDTTLGTQVTPDSIGHYTLPLSADH